MAALAHTLPRPMRGSELQQVLEAERSGSPFLVYRDESEVLRILGLEMGSECRTVGRRHTNDVALPWDPQISRVHAELEQIGGCWTVSDDGLSTNGTFVNGARVTKRRRLVDGDSVRIGSSVLLYREPSTSNGAPDTASIETQPGSVAAMAPNGLSATQRRVLIALARPFADRSGFAAPATNQQIASEVYLSVDRVKTHLRILFDKFGLAELPQNKKRLELVHRALLSGLITPSDLE